LDKVSTLIVLNTTFNLPFAVIIMSQLFKELPIELEQAAWLTAIPDWCVF
jgi:multiple sugar transport system permease protein